MADLFTSSPHPTSEESSLCKKKKKKNHIAFICCVYMCLHLNMSDCHKAQLRVCGGGVRGQLAGVSSLLPRGILGNELRLSGLMMADTLTHWVLFYHGCERVKIRSDGPGQLPGHQEVPT